MSDNASTNHAAAATAGTNHLAAPQPQSVPQAQTAAAAAPPPPPPRLPSFSEDPAGYLRHVASREPSYASLLLLTGTPASSMKDPTSLTPSRTDPSQPLPALYVRAAARQLRVEFHTTAAAAATATTAASTSTTNSRNAMAVSFTVWDEQYQRNTSTASVTHRKQVQEVVEVSCHGRCQCRCCWNVFEAIMMGKTTTTAAAAASVLSNNFFD